MESSIDTMLGGHEGNLLPPEFDFEIDGQKFHFKLYEPDLSGYSLFIPNNIDIRPENIPIEAYKLFFSKRKLTIEEKHKYHLPEYIDEQVEFVYNMHDMLPASNSYPFNGSLALQLYQLQCLKFTKKETTLVLKDFALTDKEIISQIQLYIR